VQLVEVLPDDQDVLVGVARDECLDDAVLAVRRRGEAVALLRLGRRVDETLATQSAGAM